MTEILYLKDPYLKTFVTEVTEIVGGKYIVLKETAFYPQGGGQPSDHGALTDSHGTLYRVTHVQKKEGKILHDLGEQAGFSVGEKVTCSLDWERRYALMKYHTAAHLLAAVFHQNTGAIITGNQLDVDGSRLDLDLEDADREKIGDYFAKANELIAQDLKINDSWMSREEVEKDPSLCKLAKGLPPSLTTLHILEIDDFDRQVDAGTHVKSLAEIGKLVFERLDNRGTKNRRVYFKIS